jgi:hypothetical protein
MSVASSHKFSVASKRFGLKDRVIQPQVGHIAPQMMKTYSHVRRLKQSPAGTVRNRREESALSYYVVLGMMDQKKDPRAWDVAD